MTRVCPAGHRVIDSTGVHYGMRELPADDRGGRLFEYDYTDCKEGDLKYENHDKHGSLDEALGCEKCNRARVGWVDQSRAPEGGIISSPPSRSRFREIVDELTDLHDAKQRDYGAAADPYENAASASQFGLPAWQGVAIRMNDKMQRIKTMARKGELACESLEDSFRDIAVYAVIGLILLERDKEGKQ